MTSEAQAIRAPGRADARSRNFLIRWWKNPWRKPRVLEAITWGYLAWSLLPVVIAILFSFFSASGLLGNLTVG